MHLNPPVEVQFDARSRAVETISNIFKFVGQYGIKVKFLWADLLKIVLI